MPRKELSWELMKATPASFAIVATAGRRIRVAWLTARHVGRQPALRNPRYVPARDRGSPLSLRTSWPKPSTPPIPSGSALAKIYAYNAVGACKTSPLPLLSVIPSSAPQAPKRVGALAQAPEIPDSAVTYVAPTRRAIWRNGAAA
jgi:hypothetical protein